jgi:hypothetical protein
VAVFVTVTVAPGTAAPLSSVIAPVMPLRPWAQSHEGTKKSNRPMTRQDDKQDLMGMETNPRRKTQKDFI